MRDLFSASKFLLTVVCSCAIGFIGCSTESPEFRFNEVEFRKQERKILEPGEELPPQIRQDISDFVTALFGTPEDPFFPFLEGEDDDAHELINFENLEWAAGAVASDRDGRQQGLFREHCAQCHGVTGDGKGPTSSFMNPYPRDFRHGRFKFKSTKGRVPPTHEDLRRVIEEGITGTAMPSFKLLSDEEVDALVDYVKYLGLRGQFERSLMNEISSLDDGRFLNLDKNPEQDDLADQLSDWVDELYFDLLDQWLDAEDSGPSSVPSPPEGFPATSELVSQGKTLFHGRANCGQCHGSTGLGDGQTSNYDVWTSDWLESKGVDIRDSSTYADFIEAGAFPPRPMRPRNLRLRVFRGGNRPEDVYRRIANGIDGTPMPDASALESDEIWALVAYVLNLPDEPLTVDSGSNP